MSKQIQKLDKERVLLLNIGRTIRAAKKHSLPVKRVVEFTLAAIIEQYEMRGDVEVTFKKVPARAPAGNVPTSKALADSTFTVRRPEKSVSKTTIRATKPHTTNSPTSKAPTKLPAKAPTKLPANAPTHEAPALEASNTTVTLYKPPAYVAPTKNGPKYELPNFKIRKYKNPTDDTAAALVENPRKRKASSESSDRPRQRMAPGASSLATR